MKESRSPVQNRPAASRHNGLRRSPRTIRLPSEDRRRRAVAMIGLTLCLAALLVAHAVSARSLPEAPPADASGFTDPHAGLFLVASRELNDLFFRRSVILLLHTDASGTQGLVVNRRLDVRLEEALPDLDDDRAGEHPVFFGGPVALGQFFLLTRNPVPQTEAFPIADELYFSSDRHVLDTLLALRTPEDQLHLYLGYTGWAPGQLGREIMRGSWFVTREDPTAIFEQPIETLWERLIDTLDPPGTEVRYRPHERTGRGGRHPSGGIL